jgi:hypothetical protein
MRHRAAADSQRVRSAGALGTGGALALQVAQRNLTGIATTELRTRGKRR